MDVSIIIVNYNTCQLTIQSIQSVYQFTSGLNFEVIVVDNASSDDSVQYIKNAFPEIKIIQNEKNIGFGRANNEGLKIAKGEFVFLLNSDAFLTSNALLYFLEFMKEKAHEKIAVCGGELSTGRTDPTVSYGHLPSLLDAFSSIGFFTLYKNYHHDHIASGVVNTNPAVHEVGYVNGADMFIRKKHLDDVGFFDSDFFLYFEETELSYRLKKRGYTSVIIPMIKIIHLTNGSQKPNASFNYKHLFHFCQGRNLYFVKCHGLFYSILVRICYALAEVNLSIVGKRKGNIFKKLSCILFAK